MQPPGERLTLLQHGDSFFPSGAISFSFGLETLSEDRHIDSAAAVASFLEGQLQARWATFDRGALVAAYRAAPDALAVARVDALLEAATLATELREGSRRAGRALLKVHADLGTAGAGAYRALVAKGEASGHTAAVQGLVWRGAGLDVTAAEALSAHTFATGILGAAIRLGLLGHVGAQRILQDARDLVVRLLQEPAPDLDDLCASTPEAEIAVMRHETAATRLFAN